MTLKFEPIKTGDRRNVYVYQGEERLGYMFKDRGSSIWCLRDATGEFAHEPTLAQAKAVWRKRQAAGDFAPKPTSGEMESANGCKFRWMIQGDRTPEIYGWLENADGMIVRGSAGFYRTTDPEKAELFARQYA